MSDIKTLAATWTKRITLFFLALIASFIVGILVFQQVSDGPYGMLQGGSFRSGEIVDPLTANFAELPGRYAELLLVTPGTSRTLGYLIQDGEVYIPCDLGFMWNRFEGAQKHILNLIYVFKTWHLDAMEDGEAELRIDRKRYAGFLHLVQDESINTALKMQLEELAREIIAPDVLGPEPPAPNDILFFRFEPGPKQ